MWWTVESDKDNPLYAEIRWYLSGTIDFFHACNYVAWVNYRPTIKDADRLPPRPELSNA